MDGKTIVPANRSPLGRRSLLVGTAALGASALIGAAQAQDAKVNMRISWWGSDDRHQRTLRLIKLWEGRNPGVTLAAQYGGLIGYQDKLSTEFAGRNAPDVMQIADNREALIAAGRLLGLDEYVASGQIDLSHANKGVLENVKVRGKLYSLPWGLACGCYFLDAKMFADAGVELPGYNWTWDDYAQKARAIARASPRGVYGSADIWAPAGTRSLYPFEFFLRQRAKSTFTPDGNLGFKADDLAEWFTFWDDLRKAGALPPAEVTALENGFETSPLITKRAAMYPVNSSIASSLQGLTQNRLVTMTFPNGIGGKALSGPRYGGFVNSSLQIYINADTKQKKLAVDFLNAVTNDPEFAKIQLMSRGVPLSETITRQILPDVSPIEQGMAEVVTFVEKNESPDFVPWPKTGSQIQDLMQRSHQAIAFGQSSVSQTVQSFLDGADQIIN